MQPATEVAAFERLLLAYARHFPLRKAKLRIVNALWGAASDERETTRLATLKYGDFKIPCDLREDLQRQLYFFGSYFIEEPLLSVWQEQVRGAKIILDVGANVGIYSLAALAVEPEATVHAFEPTPEIAWQLRKIAELNGLSALKVHEIAVSSNSGFAKLNRYRGERGTNGGMNFIFGGATEDDPNGVRTIRLDDFCDKNDISYIDFLKVDVQGHEYDVFRGAKNLLRAGRIGQIFFELNWTDEASDCPAGKSIKLLEAAGYEFSIISERSNWSRSGDWMRALTDVVARKIP